MRNLRELDKYRDTRPSTLAVLRALSVGGDLTQTPSEAGVFFVPRPGEEGSYDLKIIASTGNGWNHVSVSLPMRCPTWAEMELVKRLFFKPDEVAMQLHVAVANHVNMHPNVLHLWRPTDQLIPLPPIDMV